jgi:hypothetical protein
MQTPAPRTLPQHSIEATYPAPPSTSVPCGPTCMQSWMIAREPDDTILCASELAANAAQHSRSRLPGGTFTVRVVVVPDLHARIEVQDDGSPWNQAMIDPARHHGLDIVRALADEWGIDGDHASRTIWARLDWPE